MIEGAIEDNPDIATFVRQFHPPFPVGIANRMAVMEYLQMSPIVRSFVPFMVFIDRKGVIRSQYTGSDPFLTDKPSENMRNEVEKLLAEGSAKPPKVRPKRK